MTTMTGMTMSNALRATGVACMPSGRWNAVQFGSSPFLSTEYQWNNNDLMIDQNTPVFRYADTGDRWWHERWTIVDRESVPEYQLKQIL